MVSKRCILIVKQEVERLGLICKSVELGRLETESSISGENWLMLKSALLTYGLEVIENRKVILVERIKNAVTELVHGSECKAKSNFSDYLSLKLNLDYTYLANVFSELEGKTIERHIINTRIEKAKELLLYDTLSLSEISWKLGYSSVAHLSTQFKKIAGITPSHFKQINSITGGQNMCEL
ncbi:MAG: Helix-turn-helix protein [Sphingobacteriaceae bacterium]|nr:Helix-turn-helix protein [Sphingobacteriaceae bacterium]